MTKAQLIDENERLRELLALAEGSGRASSGIEDVGRLRRELAEAQEQQTATAEILRVGIAPEDQAAIFEEFRQVGRDETRKQEGTGLGLTLAKKFVELHGGRMWVESEVAAGSTFTFSIPLRHGE